MVNKKGALPPFFLENSNNKRRCFLFEFNKYKYNRR